jgi:hypothetical protein
MLNTSNGKTVLNSNGAVSASVREHQAYKAVEAAQAAYTAAQEKERAAWAAWDAATDEGFSADFQSRCFDIAEEARRTTWAAFNAMCKAQTALREGTY